MAFHRINPPVDYMQDSSNDLQEQVDSSTGGSPYRSPAAMPPNDVEALKGELALTEDKLRKAEKELEFRRWRELALAYLAVMFFGAFAISLFCHLINHHEHLFR